MVMVMMTWVMMVMVTWVMIRGEAIMLQNLPIILFRSALEIILHIKDIIPTRLLHFTCIIIL